MFQAEPASDRKSEYLELVSENPDQAASDLVEQDNQSVRFLDELEKSDSKAKYKIKIGDQEVWVITEGGMGTYVSGKELAKSILSVGGLARLSSIDGGAYHPDRKKMGDNPKGRDELYKQVDILFDRFKNSVGARDVDLYDFLDLTKKEHVDSKLGATNHAHLLDVLKLGEDILELKQAPNITGKGMLGVNIMKKTQSYERMIKLAALAFSGDVQGDRSNGMLSLSAGVSDDVLEILYEAKKLIPNLQIPRLDFVVSMGASTSKILEMSKSVEKYDFPPDLITIENMNAGGHLGGVVPQIKRFEADMEARRAGEMPEINTKRMMSSVNIPDVIYATLDLMQKNNIYAPLSFAGGLTLDTEEQKQIINFVSKYSKELELSVKPRVMWQLGTAFAVTAEGDAAPKMKADMLAAAYDGDNQKLLEIRRINRQRFREVIEENLDFLEKISGGEANIMIKREWTDMRNPQDQALAKKINTIKKRFKKRLEFITQALKDLNAGKDTVIFMSTVGFPGRAVPNETLAKIMLGIQLREGPCQACLTTCAYEGIAELSKLKSLKAELEGRGEKTRNVSVATRDKKEEPSWYQFEVNGKRMRISPEGFCIVRMLDHTNRKIGQLVFRGAKKVQGEVVSAPTVIADGIQRIEDGYIYAAAA